MALPLYFAYGSNLHQGQMASRCPESELVGMYRLKGWRLVFRNVADIIPDKRSVVHGALYRLTPHDEAVLDRYEGYPNSYQKVYVYDPDMGEPIMAYVMAPRHRSHFALPWEGYYQTIWEGYGHVRLDRRRLIGAVRWTAKQIHGRRRKR